MVVSENVREMLRPMVVATTVLWVAVTVTIVGLVVAATFVAPGSAPRAIPEGLHNSLVTVAVLCGIGSIWFRRRMLSDQKLQAVLSTDAASACLDCAQGNDGLDESKLERIESLGVFERRVLALPRWHFLPFLISLMLNEAVVVVGFVIVVLSAGGESIVPFAVAALILNILMFPRFESLLSRAQGLFQG